MLRISQHLITVGDLDGALLWLTKIIELDFDYGYPLAVFLKIEVLYRLQRHAQAYTFGQKFIEEMGYEWFDSQEAPLRKLMTLINECRFQSPENETVSSSQTLNQIPLPAGNPLYEIYKWPANEAVLFFCKVKPVVGKRGFYRNSLINMHFQVLCCK